MREDGASAVDRGKTAVAPMPCKVLSVLKSSGEAVKPGESVMVVESMKMEMTISLAAGGTFEALVNKDDAVEEGVVLCRVS
jgi:biotin carboxyl carrier protein